MWFACVVHMNSLSASAVASGSTHSHSSANCLREEEEASEKIESFMAFWIQWFWLMGKKKHSDKGRCGRIIHDDMGQGSPATFPSSQIR